MRYLITVKGHLDQRWSEWFEGLTITLGAGGETILSGQLADQAALYGTLMKIYDLGLPLLAVMPAATAGEPSDALGDETEH